MDADGLARVRRLIERLRIAEAGATPGPWFALAINAYATDPDAWAGPGFRPSAIVGAREPLDVAAIVALRNAAPALLALAEAAGRLRGVGDDSPWWRRDPRVGDYYFCSQCHNGVQRRPPFDVPTIEHAPDCPALAIDAALADLAALAGDADAGGAL